MALETVERVVQALVVGLMNGLLYFPGHRRVVQATEDVVGALGAHFEREPLMVLGLREGLLIFEGEPLYDLSVYAHRLVRALRDRNAWGLRFERGVTSEEVRGLVGELLSSQALPAAEINARLEQRGITRLALEEKPLVERGTEGVARGSLAAQALAGQDLSVEVYTTALAVLQDIMVELRRGERASFARANDVAASLADAVRAHRQPLIALTSIKDYDEYTFNHSVNVCIYITALAEGLTTEDEELVRIARAGLLHDVGKILISDDILYKPGRLSDGEWQVMRQHPVVGAKILVEAQGVDELAVNVAFGHHLRYDRKGYPELSGKVELDPVTELVNVVDVYEAITAKRPYKKPVPPERVVDILLEGAGHDFNPFCVEAFLSSFGVYPPGTRVLLDSGVQGQVLSANPQDPFRPAVQVSNDVHGQPLDRAEVVDTAERDATGNYITSIAGSVA